MIDRIKGSRKWNEKNRFRVGLLTLNPPHNHWVIFDPKIGIVDRRLVITVAPHRDICPHGRMYPENAVLIRMRRIKIPECHVCLFLKELFIRARKM